jgi:hypothetical protein
MDMTLSRMMNWAIKQDKHHWTMCLEITVLLLAKDPDSSLSVALLPAILKFQGYGNHLYF